jgi:hypothetical protein
MGDFVAQKTTGWPFVGRPVVAFPVDHFAKREKKE